jgi:hypothetical protein
VDECDNAAAIYQCGREKQPAMVASIVTASSGNTSQVILPIFFA